ncbi:hypothetical protein ACHHYP_11782 [Achlya hypogyna]|uniref:Uncharacterized protein n=1 Tax=Achlya hypogyna TaxID=1202772 RepID=A0A1V9YIC5_ACHHY|nr:hypothetical protein ACHHYP_11782 [Achlya hypogyna]
MSQYVMGDSTKVLEQQFTHKTATSVGCLLASSLAKTRNVVVPKIITVVAVLRGETIDLSRATFVHPTTHIKVYAILGGVRILVPRGVRFASSGVGVAGLFLSATEEDQPALSTEAPFVLITGVSILGKAAPQVNHDAAPVAMTYSFAPATHRAQHPSVPSKLRAR